MYCLSTLTRNFMPPFFEINTAENMTSCKGGHVTLRKLLCAFRLPEHTDSSGYQENRPIFDYLKESEEERPVFDYLKDHRSSPSSDALSDTKYDGQMEDLKGFTHKTTNGHATSYDKPEHEYRDEYGYEDEQRPGYKDEQRHGYKDEQRHGYKGEQKHGFEIEQRPGYEDKQKFGYEGDKSPDYKDSATSSFEDEQRPAYEDKQGPGYEVDHRSGYQDELKPGYQGEHRLSYQGSETSGTYHDAQSWRSQDSQLDTDSLDTFTSGEFLTPKETPNHSDVNTPVQSSPDHSDEGDSYRDARDATPVPMDRDSIDGLPLKYGNHDLVPPQITTTAISDDEGDKFGETQMDGTQRPRGNDEDIDQAFHDYGSSDFGGLKLQDRLEMGSRESIVSYYSDAGEGNYGNIPVTGEVQVGLRYDYKHEKLEVQVHRARDIAPVDTKKKRSDPYIKVYLLPDKTKGGKRKTKTKKHTLDPTFDEILQFKIGFDEMLTRTLWLTVWNHDRFGHNDFLGEIMLPLAQYDESGFNWAQPSAEWYPLRERRPEPSLMKYCGEIVVALKYAPPATPEAKGKGKKKKKHSEKGELQVVIKEARNLPAKDANGFSDPFVKAYLLPDKGRKSKRKTPTIRKNLNPQWNFPFTYDDVTLEELMDRSLELTVWDWDRGASNDFLGGVRLGMGTKQEKWDDAEGQEITAWQAMMDFPNEWHDSTLTLSSSLSRFYDSTTSQQDTGAKETPDSSPEKYDRISGSDQDTKSEGSYENLAFDSCNDDEGSKPSFLKNFPDFLKLKLSSEKKDESRSISNDSEQRTSNYGSIMKSPEERSISSEESKDSGHASIENETVVPKTIITEPEPKPARIASDKPKNARDERRNTENVLFFEGATLSPTIDTRRRHSTDMVSVSKPINEELIEDFVKKSPGQRRKTSRDNTDGKINRRNMGSLYSPRAARKKLENTKKAADQRRPTLAELAKEAGYQRPPQEQGDLHTASLMASHEREISSSSDAERDANDGVTGELYLALEYCIKTKTFSIHVLSANNLTSRKDSEDSADPYVKTYLLPDKRSKKKTKIIKDNLNPEFDEIIKYHIGYDELMTRTLSVTVWNDRLGANEFLGEVLISMSSYVEGHSMENPQPQWHPLGEKTLVDESASQPEIILSLKYVTAEKVKRKSKRQSIASKGELHVHIMEAKNLPGKDADGMSDPFCKITLLPDKKGKTRHKTAIIKRTLNPSWDYNLIYEELSQEELRQRVLEISIWDHDIASRDEFLGGLRLGLGTSANEWDDSSKDEAQIWHTMLTRTNVWIQVVVPLRPNMDAHKHQ
ncbi:uncharacterized protein LOC5500410 isoform X2 [Nematostella vectensis]|uniref:uncharacterized protein LOC5500410 isoform X2 n=1 Tax=Nematostella vectensis TaxID=45351 RepID=UPI002076E03A|nr:uncharacterized protein LOC5500410 isoform X2 [Nematostella vectensis]